VYAPSVDNLIVQLARLPGVGRRTAQRLAFHLLKASEADALALADAIRSLRGMAPDERDRLGANGRAYVVGEHSYANLAGRYAAVIDEAILPFKKPSTNATLYLGGTDRHHGMSAPP